MSATNVERLTDFAGLVPARGTYPIAANTKILKGTLVGEDSAGRAIAATTLATCVRVLGKASATVDNTGGAAAALGVEVEHGIFDWANSAGADEIAADDIGKLCYAVDNQTVALTSNGGTRPIAGIITEFRNGVPWVWSSPIVPVFYDTLTILASTANAEGAALIGIEDAANNFASTTVEAALAEIIADYAATTATNGANKIGYQDSGNKTTAATVDEALDEVYAYLLASRSIPLSLHAFRECDANGDFANTAGNGGLLASDTTPILRGDAAESTEISWAAGNADPISTQIALPADFDDTQDVTIDCWVSSGAGDAASLAIETGWNGGALVSDALNDAATKSATAHKVTATVANGDIPAGAAYVTMILTPPAHAGDAIKLHGIRLNYTPKLA